MNLKAIYNSIVKDTRAVSPVVASLILVVVAVVGAATIGVMMGVVGEDVGEQADADQVGDASRAVIQLATSGGYVWNVTRPIAKDFTEANPGIGFIRHEVQSRHIIYAVSEGIADVGIRQSFISRAAEFILNAQPDTATLDAFLNKNDGVNDSLVMLSNYSPLGGNCNRTNLTYLFRETSYSEWRNIYTNLTTRHYLVFLVGTIFRDPALKDNWDAHLVNHGVKEFVTRIQLKEEWIPVFMHHFNTDTINYYFYTHNDPSPTEQAFIDYLRLKAFS